MRFRGFSASFVFPLLLVPMLSAAQNNTNTNGSSSGAISTAVPFLTISPDSRSGALGDAGVAISPDVNANFWNPSKLAFLEDQDAVALSYSPWLRHLVPDISLSYLSYAHKIDDRNSIGASLRYFNLGSIQLVDVSQNNQGVYRPSEFSLDVSFARKFGDNFSMGLTGRYIHSDLSNESFATGVGQQTNSGNAAAADISLYYRSAGQQFGTDAVFAFGTDISNIGTKITYSAGGTPYFLPTNLKIGVADTWNFDQYDALTLTLDLNKLLVPTPPIRDASGNIIKGRDDNVSVPAGIFGSFTDAPGGFSEEMQEISFSPGVEYAYNRQFFIRAGYFYENPNKGNRQYLTMGVGVKYDVLKFDFSYLAASQQNSALANTIRVSLSATFGSVK